MMDTTHHGSSPLLATGNTDEETNDRAHSIIQALHLIQVIYLVFAGIIALLFAILNIVGFAVLLVAFVGYYGLFWYNVASSARTKDNAIALTIRAFSVAAVLAASAQSSSFYNVYTKPEFFIIQRAINIFLLLVVSVLDWRWNGLVS
jgi:hypothetical protein